MYIIYYYCNLDDLCIFLGKFISETFIRELTVADPDWHDVALFPKLKFDFVDIQSITDIFR